MDILKRELAPIPMEAWTEIDAQATRSLTATLSARKVLDVTGPMGPLFFRGTDPYPFTHKNQ
jgi:uncharacterized linocin/CFP29 family protein